MQKVFLLLAFLGGVAVTLVAQRGPAAIPDAVSADPRHYSVSFENDVVRLLRVRYPAGERSVMHRHPASCAVFLTDQTFDFTLADGTTAPATVPEDALGCSDGNIHLPHNTGRDAEFIMIEFKNRQRFNN
jgi:hypothetical protein